MKKLTKKRYRLTFSCEKVNGTCISGCRSWLTGEEIQEVIYELLEDSAINVTSINIFPE